jgi:ubiquinone/menaquinone biosynthesis C-methylase UbiE
MSGSDRVESRRFDPAKWERLLSPERHALLDPAAFLRRIAVHEGSAVADLGAGPGFFTLPLAEAVGPAGRIYAIDVAPAMVERLRERGPPDQVEVLLGGEAGLPLADGSIDLALLAFVLHELDDTLSFLAEVRRVLRRGGRLVVLEWVPQEEELGPPLHERLPRDAAAAMLAEGGFRVAEAGDANASNYFITARPAER